MKGPFDQIKIFQKNVTVPKKPKVFSTCIITPTGHVKITKDVTLKRIGKLISLTKNYVY